MAISCMRVPSRSAACTPTLPLARPRRRLHAHAAACTPTRRSAHPRQLLRWRKGSSSDGPVCNEPMLQARCKTNVTTGSNGVEQHTSEAAIQCRRDADVTESPRRQKPVGGAAPARRAAAEMGTSRRSVAGRSARRLAAPARAPGRTRRVRARSPASLRESA
eukprot:6174188-Pleurochrysis_carterae.AAC.4